MKEFFSKKHDKCISCFTKDKPHAGKGKCRNCYTIDYRLKNEKKVKKINKRYYRKNEEKIKAYRKEYYQKRKNDRNT